MFTSGMFSAAGSTTVPGSGGWMGIFSSTGTRTRAGVSVTPDSALALTAVQRAVTILSESFAQLPCNVYQVAKSGSIQKVKSHPVSYLLNHRPNGWMTPFEFNEFKQSCVSLDGNSVAMILRDSKGQMESVHPFAPQRVQIMVSPVDRMPYYRILKSPLDDFQGVYSAEDIHHVRWISRNGYAGLSPIFLHAEAVGVVAAVEEYSGSVFGNGTKLSGVLEYQQQIKDPEDIRKIARDWEEKYSGSSNAGRVAVLTGGGKFSPLSMSNEDAELLATRGWGVNDVSRIYGVPVHMLGDNSGGAKANFEQMGLEFVTYTLMPWVKRHAEANNRDFFSRAEIEAGFYTDYDPSALMRGDLASRMESYAKSIQWGIENHNEIRAHLNLPPREGGDKYLEPMNMADGKTGVAIGKQQPKEGK